PLPTNRVMLQFSIRPSGRTSGVKLGAQVRGTVFEKCLTGSVKRWRFPAFTGEPIPVEYPLILQGGR
ncbi:MAG: AgmX/PglI C-terminal domain-containing protein, partial [Myxococcales bacterium]|nr:AgmX/PglI C-terminal domain-containing protein [Myxococcales bacterium]